MSKPSRKEQVVKFHSGESGVFYTRPFEVAAVYVMESGARALVAGGKTIVVQETLPEIFRRLNWEQAQ